MNERMKQVWTVLNIQGAGLQESYNISDDQEFHLIKNFALNSVLPPLILNSMKFETTDRLSPFFFLLPAARTPQRLCNREKSVQDLVHICLLQKLSMTTYNRHKKVHSLFHLLSNAVCDSHGD